MAAPQTMPLLYTSSSLDLVTVAECSTMPTTQTHTDGTRWLGSLTVPQHRLTLSLHRRQPIHQLGMFKTQSLASQRENALQACDTAPWQLAQRSAAQCHCASHFPITQPPAGYSSSTSTTQRLACPTHLGFHTAKSLCLRRRYPLHWHNILVSTMSRAVVSPA